MTYTEILELIRAGYKRDEIEAMMEAEKNAKVQTSIPPAAAQEDMPIIKEETPAPAPALETAPEQREPTETEKLVAALGMKIDSLTRAMQTRNANSIESPGSNAPSADEVLAKIINPHYGEV